MRLVLNMIVKDGEPHVTRAIESVIDFVDTYCIVVDTDCSKTTKDTILASLKGLPGGLFEREWKNFGHNRSEAIELAKQFGTHAIVLDADDVIEVTKEMHDFPEADAYELRVRDGDTVYSRLQIFKLEKNWRYVGIHHEYPTCEGGDAKIAALDGLTYVRLGKDEHSPEKYLKEAKALEEALKEEPTNTRYAFYAAQSWRDAGQLNRAYQAFRRRLNMAGGWIEETWAAAYEAAKLIEITQENDIRTRNEYLCAFELRPTRAEPLYQLARYYRTVQTNFAQAFLYASAAHHIPKPSDRLFLDESIYLWRIQDELALAAYYVGLPLLATRLNQELLRSSNRLPEAERPRILKNLEFCLQQLRYGGQPTTRVVLVGPENTNP